MLKVPLVTWDKIIEILCKKLIYYIISSLHLFLINILIITIIIKKIDLTISKSPLKTGF